MSGPHVSPETLASSMFADRRAPAPIRELAHEQPQAPASEAGLRATHPPYDQPGVFPEDALAVNFSNAKVVRASFSGSMRELEVDVGSERLKVRVEDNKFEVQTGPSRVHAATAAQTAQLRALLARTAPGDLQYTMQL